MCPGNSRWISKLQLCSYGFAFLLGIVPLGEKPISFNIPSELPTGSSGPVPGNISSIRPHGVAPSLFKVVISEVLLLHAPPPTPPPVTELILGSKKATDPREEG